MLIGSGCNFLSERIYRSPTTSSKKDEPYVHQVKWQGEILSIIATWYTGDMNNWRTIAKTNPDLNPKKIAIGDKIRIPSALLITRKPMPNSYLTEFYTRQKIKSPSPAPAARPEIKDKTSTPAPTPQPEPPKKQAPPKPAQRPETQYQTPTPATASQPEPPKKKSRPKTEQQPDTQEQAPAPENASQPEPQKKQAQPESEKEPVLFGPKGYSK